MTTEMDGSGPLVSVIVPVYKVEEYLDECVQSILGQTHKNLEIILVDDGSPDRCGEICDGYAAQDSRVVVIHQGNRGVSAARNAGLDIAHGEYFSFVDADDLIAEDMIELQLDSLSGEENAISVCIELRFSGDLPVVDRKGSAEYSSLEPEEALKRLLLKEGGIAHAIVGKLYDRRCCEMLRFQESIHFAEDTLFNCKAMCACSKVVMFRFPLYFYRQRIGSAMHSAFSENNLDILEAARQIRTYMEDRCPQLEVVANLAVMQYALKLGHQTLAGCADPVLKRKALELAQAAFRDAYTKGKGEVTFWRGIYFVLARINLPAACILRRWSKGLTGGGKP